MSTKELTIKTIRLRYLLILVVLPVAWAAACVTSILAIKQQLPNPVASHWDLAGQVNGVMSLSGSLWLFTGLAILIPGLFLISLYSLDAHHIELTALGIGIAPIAGVSILISTIGWLSLFNQRGLTSAYDSTFPLTNLLIAFGIAAVITGLCWLYLRPIRALAKEARKTWAAPRAIQPMEINPAAKVSWFRLAKMNPYARTIIWLAVIGTGIGAIWALLIGEASIALPLGIVFVILLVLAMTATAFWVQIDKTGLRVASMAGFPKYYVPLKDITDAAVEEVMPMAQFGGYGLRNARGAFGVILRQGEGLVVTRTNGRKFVVTVDGAEQAASVLMGLKQVEGA